MREKVRAFIAIGILSFLLFPIHVLALFTSEAELTSNPVKVAVTDQILSYHVSGAMHDGEGGIHASFTLTNKTSTAVPIKISGNVSLGAEAFTLFPHATEVVDIHIPDLAAADSGYALDLIGFHAFIVETVAIPIPWSVKEEIRAYHKEKEAEEEEEDVTEEAEEIEAVDVEESEKEVTSPNTANDDKKAVEPPTTSNKENVDQEQSKEKQVEEKEDDVPVSTETESKPEAEELNKQSEDDADVGASELSDDTSVSEDE